MSESDTIACPECESEQPTTAPFCQNCGYRMRSPKTVREPMLAFGDDTTDDGDDSTSNDGEQSAEMSSNRPSRRIVGSGGDTAPEEIDEPPAPESRGPDTGTDTLVEGMRAVSPRDTSDADATDEPADPRASDSSPTVDGQAVPSQDHQTARLPVDRQRSKIRWIVGGTLVACVAVVAGLSWLHLERQAAGAESPGQLVEPEVITIDEGPFRRGLSEQAQAFILEFCYRYHDDPDEACDRELLLDGEYPERTVKMPEYDIDAIPVRNTDYRECVDSAVCDPVDYENCDVWTPQGLQVGARVPRVLRRDHHPVVCVDRRRAIDYCEFKDGSLPTHNQWEKAARGDETPLFPWGDRWQPDRANWGERDVMRVPVPGRLDGYAWTSPPGAFPDGISPTGVYDMAGNVSEWVRGEDPLMGYVRGGSWTSNPFELRTTARTPLDVEAKRTDVGFRCVY